MTKKQATEKPKITKAQIIFIANKHDCDVSFQGSDKTVYIKARNIIDIRVAQSKTLAVRTAVRTLGYTTGYVFATGEFGRLAKAVQNF